MDFSDIEALLFDLDGVLTPTAQVHEEAWKRTFDDFLRHRAHDGFDSFTRDDYLTYVDGKPRYEGVPSFLVPRRVTSSR